MAKSNRERQAAYRNRKLKQGYTIVTVMLDPETSKIVKGLKGNQLSIFICQAIKAAVTNNKSIVINNKVDSKTETVMNKKPSKPSRYMSAELEDYILKLREEGLKLKEVSARLADEGIFSITGQPLRTGTLSKAEARARQRRKGN